MTVKLFETNKIQSYKNMPDLIAEALKEAVLQGQYKGGVQLKQDEIAKRFNVSLIPVREALIQLEAQKLVVCIRNKGAMVTTLSVSEMKMVFELRKILEVGSIRQAKDRDLSIQIEKMNHLIGKMTSERDIFAFSRYDRLFHELVCESACNAKLSDTYRNIFVRVERYLMYMYDLISPQEQEVMEHRLIVKLLEDGNYDELAEVVSRHIEEKEEYFIKYLEKHYDTSTLEWNEFLPFGKK